jgi:hypothetical protein
MGLTPTLFATSLSLTLVLLFLLDPGSTPTLFRKFTVIDRRGGMPCASLVV